MENVPKILTIAGIAIVAVFAFAFVVRQAAAPKTDILTVGDDPAEEQTFQIVTLLGFDAIRSIDQPTFVDAATGNEQLAPDDLVLGVSINGDVRAYGIAFLSSSEIVNDTVGGRPIAVTW